MKSEPRWVLAHVVEAIHLQQLTEHGGGPGVRDVGLLASALARPQQLFAYGGNEATLPRLAAAYAFGLARNHAFVDGNKRTALVVSFLFLRLNGLDVNASPEDRFLTFLALAEGSLGEPELAQWFARHCVAAI